MSDSWIMLNNDEKETGNEIPVSDLYTKGVSDVYTDNSDIDLEKGFLSENEDKKKEIRNKHKYMFKQDLKHSDALIKKEYIKYYFYCIIGISTLYTLKSICG